MRVGIVTHFLGSRNYGGVLQAYALAQKLNLLGYDAQQIKYRFRFENLKSEKAFKNRIKRILAFLKQTKHKNQGSGGAKDAFGRWVEENIPQSKERYTYFDVKRSVPLYDAFITGSDQVFNYSWYDKNFFLDFVPKGKCKLSYSASMGHSEIDDYQKKVFKKHFKSFDGISVRESDMISLLKDTAPVEIHQTVDPVLLLSREEWDKVASDPIINEPYLLCYFLGGNRAHIKLVKEYAAKKGLKIVLPATYNGKLAGYKEILGDCEIVSATPGGFVSLIKHAEIVLTDSFHASAFSGIYQKKLLVFPRGQEKISSRLISLFETLGGTECLLSDERQSLEYMLKAENTGYKTPNPAFEELKKASVEFLTNTLSAKKPS